MFIIKTNQNQETLNFILKLSSKEMSKKLSLYVLDTYTKLK
nr:MAG TPA: hypothetical protein [Caudoviricetes sp.]